MSRLCRWHICLCERKVRAAQGAPLPKIEAIGDSRLRQKRTTAGHVPVRVRRWCKRPPADGWPFGLCRLEAASSCKPSFEGARPTLQRRWRVERLSCRVTCKLDRWQSAAWLALRNRTRLIGTLPYFFCFVFWNMCGYCPCLTLNAHIIYMIELWNHWLKTAISSRCCGKLL